MEDQKKLYAVQRREQRMHPRYSLDEDCALLIAGYEKPAPCSIVELSQEGCRVRTQERIAAHSDWPVEISFKVRNVAFVLSGTLQWIDGQRLMGIRFVNVIPRRMLDLAEVLCEMEAVVAARAGKINAIVAEHSLSAMQSLQADDPAEAAFSAASETVTRSTDAATAKAAADPQAMEGEQASKQDRRSAMRHEVDNFATISLVKAGTTLHGRIMDLSLTGCRIRTNERFPVGIYTRIETEFHLEGLPFRLGGVIQAIHDRNTVGIRFLDLSERKRRQVMDLILEIQEMRACLAQTQTTMDGYL